MRYPTIALAPLATVVALVQSVTVGAAPKEQASSDIQDERNWASYGRDYTEDHFSPLTQINTQTVAHLSLAWFHDFDIGQRTDSQPLAAAGVVYVVTGHSVVRAIDGRSGRLLWRYDSQAGQVSGAKLRSGWGVRGLALWGGRVFVGTTDGRLLSLDAKNGELQWSVQTLNSADDTSISGAPRAFNGKVVIGFGGGDLAGTRGAVNCYDALTGKHLWRFYTVPGDPSNGFENGAMRRAARTWSGEYWKVGGGGAVWHAITYDPELNRVYIGTGNANPWNVHIRDPKGLDNLFTASIVALHADTGAYLWHYQENPADAWDYDSIADIELAHLKVAGKIRRVILHAPKNGFFYVIDRDTGRLISADKYGKATWAERIDLRSGRPVEAPGIRYELGSIILWPGSLGMHNWQAMSFSPLEAVAFVPALNTASNYNIVGVDEKTWKPREHDYSAALGDTESGVPDSEYGSSLLAWDTLNKRELWRVRTTGMWGGGTMATAGGLVFQGQMDGAFIAYDSRTGSKLWSFQAHSPVLGAPMSYSLDGKQYITVLSGPPGGAASYEPDAPQFGWRYREHPRQVLTFMLDGNVSLPESPPPGPPTPIKSDSPYSFELASEGALLFGTYCGGCHGRNAISGGFAPDLRASAIPLTVDSFAAVVHQGAFVARGMPRFEELSGHQLEALRNYIRARAQGRQIDSSAPQGPGR